MKRGLFIFTVALVLWCGCGREPEVVKAPAAPRTFEVRGILRGWDADGRHARISHEAIPGYMEAMTMEFEVADETARERKGGEAIAFRLTVGEGRAWIDQVRKIEAVLKVPDMPEAPAAAELPKQMPDVALTDETGRAFRLSEHRGETLALTFIFTRCPFPTYCPLLNARFAAVQRELPAKGRWHLFSITLDPDYDTPERLAAYAKTYPRDGGRWTFATGSRAEIRQLGAAVGLAVAEGGALPEHNLRTVVIDPNGRVRKVFAGNEWTSADLERAMQPEL